MKSKQEQHNHNNYKHANKYQEKDAIVIRNYQLWEGTHKFYFKGKLMVGPKVRNLIISTILINLPNILNFAFTQIGYADGNSDPVLIIIGVILWISTNYFLFKTALSDPGFIPRQPEDQFIQINKNEFKNYLIRNGQQGLQNSFVRIKFCKTCNIYRPPRTVHCSICDSCVEIMDHHCPWVSNCVGKRNYRRFFIFANLLWINCLFVLITSATDIQRRVDSYKQNEGLESTDAIQEAFKSHPLSLPIIVFCFLALIGVSVLIFYHYKITLEYITTHEELKSVFGGYFYHPFNALSFIQNFKHRLVSNKIPKKKLFKPTEEAKTKENFDQGIDTNKSGVDKNTVSSQSEDQNLIEQNKHLANTNDVIKYNQHPVNVIKNQDDDFDKLESLLEEEDFDKKQDHKDPDNLKKSKKFYKTQGLSLDLIESRRNSNGAIDTQMTPSQNLGGTFRESIVTQHYNNEGDLQNIRTNRELIQTQDVNIEIISSSSSMGNKFNFEVNYNDNSSPKPFKAQKSLANSLIKSAVCYQEQNNDDDDDQGYDVQNNMHFDNQYNNQQKDNLDMTSSQNMSRYSNTSSRKSRKLQRVYNNYNQNAVGINGGQQQQQDSLFPFAQDPNYPYGVQFPQESNDSKEFEFLVEIDENQQDLRSQQLQSSQRSSAIKFQYDKENQSEDVVSLRSHSKHQQNVNNTHNQNGNYLEQSKYINNNENDQYRNNSPNFNQSYYNSNQQNNNNYPPPMNNDYDYDKSLQSSQFYSSNIKADNSAAQTQQYRNPFELPSGINNNQNQNQNKANNGRVSQPFNALRDVSKMYIEENTQKQTKNNLKRSQF